MKTDYRNIKNTFFVLIGLAALSGLPSCTKDILDTSPKTDISELTAFSTPEKILAQVNNLYSRLQRAHFYGGRYILFNEQRGDEFSQNSGNAAEGALIWQHTALSTDTFVGNLWSFAYQAINNANIFIDKVQNTTVLDAALRDQYISEAKFIRALSYFVLVQVYARPYASDNGASPGLPLRLTPQTSGGNDDLARSSVAEVYSQVIKDLDEAEAGLPAAYSTAALNASRAHKVTAIALKTRVYLAKADYGRVVAEASKLVPAVAPYAYTAGSLTHRLENNIAAVFSGSYTGNEAIFFLPFNATDSPDSQSALAHNYLGAVIISLNQAGIYANPALSSSASADARRNLITLKNGLNVLSKFPKITTPFTDYIPVIRYAEVLLNYAEAAAETDDLTRAAALLNAVRKRSDAAYSFPDAATSTKGALISTILTERRLELLGEGFRTPDLQRRLQPFPAKTGGIGTVAAVSPTASNYIWPVPADELGTNKLIQPNP
ncbi:RagB/SusD family nutrient uptake outer membrane protein [Pararcticibacter amylolyticus]|uniref:RagB/SusD family nutrient uptake outer membrane protein n=1 Tax=Pararcticibacter amylolyticus TaxID=2173175 RepID=A0A2U2PAG3_9SPHI|nr:RagB/SusD family nutrient uptake outer membrane protein [Pararcticibacter amylolyticus]PWG78377.1 RagB/SusD family nutrient uptake outer membrane protein [Pararcticibacter amylolyticus]